jgi:hypothetical protein
MKAIAFMPSEWSVSVKGKSDPEKEMRDTVHNINVVKLQ